MTMTAGLAGDPDEGPPVLEQIGPYRIVDRIGEGGMGVVYMALDPSGRAVAIKVLRPSIAHDPDARARLGREVETLTRVNTPRVASVIDADIMGPQPYIVTRYVPGPSLDEVVATAGALPPADLLRVGRGLAEAVRAIHAVGVIHRDVKPGNVLIEDGDPVLIDFGIAHIADDARVTSTGLVMGTPGYLSPELVAGAEITDATDWWGWAATLTYAASGRPPFGRGSMEVVLARVRNGEPDLTGIDQRLAPLLSSSLSPEPDRRPHSQDVLAGLERYAAGGYALPPQGPLGPLAGGVGGVGGVGGGPGSTGLPGAPGAPGGLGGPGAAFGGGDGGGAGHDVDRARSDSVAARLAIDRAWRGARGATAGRHRRGVDRCRGGLGDLVDDERWGGVVDAAAGIAFQGLGVGASAVLGVTVVTFLVGSLPGAQGEMPGELAVR